jgi:hypothetical protein
VKDLQTNTGVKDAYTQHWIDYLIGRARDLQKENPGRPAEEIQAELIVWVNDNKSKIYNGFLTLKGVLCRSHFCLTFQTIY